MCMMSGGGGGGSTANITEQLNKGNALLSNEKVTSTTGEKKTKKRTVSSLRVPIKSTNTSTVGANTNETATGLNIPV